MDLGKKMVLILASFVKSNAPLVDQWLVSLNAVNPDEKKSIINRWVDEIIDAKRVLGELFGSSNGEWTTHLEVA